MKKVSAFVLAIFTAIGVIAPNVAAISGGAFSCSKLETTFSASSSESGTAMVILSENCKIDNIYIKSGQNITLDVAIYTLETKFNIESGGKLTITSSDAAGTISGSIDNKGGISITGGKFTFDPSRYLAEGYTTNIENGLYVVSAKKNSSIIDTSKIIASNEDTKNALIKTLENQVEDPETDTENGRILDQLLNAIKNGHTLSATVKVTAITEVSSALQDAILKGTAGMNLGSVSDVKFVVTDTTNNKSVELTSLATPATVILTIPDAYKAQLKERKVEIMHIYTTENNDYDTDIISNISFDGNGNLTFKTSEFSTFAMAYDGAPIIAVGGDTSVPQTSAANTASTDVVAPDTAGFLGVDLTVFNLLMILGATFVVIAIIAYISKRVYIRNKISWK